MDISLLTFNENSNVMEALEALDKGSKRLLFIVDDNGCLKGSLSDGDVRRYILQNGDLRTSVRHAMNSNVHFLTEPDEQKARKIMAELEITAVPVTDITGKIIKIYFCSGETLGKKHCISAKVVIMAGGRGERLLPYTNIVPKPLLPIGDKAIAERVIDSFLEYGCTDFILSLCYKSKMIKAYFQDIKKDYGLSYIEEDRPLGTGGSLYLLKDSLKETFFVSNCDILLKVDYADVFRFHRERENAVTMLASLKRYTIPYGVLNLDSEGQIQSLAEKPALDYLVNTGVYLIEPEVLSFLEDNEYIHITQLIERCLQRQVRVGTYPISESSWMDMGQFDDMGKMKKSLEG